jgi:ribosomal-protein-alanine N-acetyltransferase
VSAVRIRALSADDAGALLRFELEHRAFFERRITARDPSFYSEQGVRAAIAAAGEAWARDEAFQYLVLEDRRLVGRVNLSQVRRAHFHGAELGYRIGEHDNGRGIASRAVALCLAQAFGVHGLWRVQADARVDNAGSVRVLERNGFTQYGHSRRSFELAGTWHDRLHFERHRDAPPVA